LKVVVTGGYGFVGSHLVERLLLEGHVVRVLDNMTNGNESNLEKVATHPNFDPIRMDVCSHEIAPIVKGADAVVHLAAITGEEACHNQPAASAIVNVNGTLNLLQACAKEHVGRFIFASSASVYGQQETLPLREDMVLKPTSIYGATKAAAEMYVQAFARAYGMSSICLRFANLYGPRRNPKYPVAVMNFAKAVVKGGNITIYGDGKQSRNFTHVSDAVEAIMLALVKGGNCGEPYNIASREKTTVNQLAEIFIEMAENKRPEVIYAPARVGDRDSFMSTEKARTELGFEAKVDLRQGLAEFVQWVRSIS
jgi:nucleoside-diphosphate-sugar epimerase